SASRPKARARYASIWKMRDCAVTNPWARIRSGRLLAKMYGMPLPSRSTSTGSLSAENCSVPVTFGPRPSPDTTQPTAAATTSRTTTNPRNNQRIRTFLIAQALGCGMPSAWWERQWVERLSLLFVKLAERTLARAVDRPGRPQERRPRRAVFAPLRVQPGGFRDGDVAPTGATTP